MPFQRVTFFWRDGETVFLNYFFFFVDGLLVASSLSMFTLTSIWSRESSSFLFDDSLNSSSSHTAILELLLELFSSLLELEEPSAGSPALENVLG